MSLEERPYSKDLSQQLSSNFLMHTKGANYLKMIVKNKQRVHAKQPATASHQHQSHAHGSVLLIILVLSLVTKTARAFLSQGRDFHTRIKSDVEYR